MDLRYVFSKQPVAEGERVVLYQGGKLYVRTSLKAASVDDPAAQSVTYTLREVYDAATVTPPGGTLNLTFEVPAS